MMAFLNVSPASNMAILDIHVSFRGCSSPKSKASTADCYEYSLNKAGEVFGRGAQQRSLYLLRFLVDVK